jgi:F-type H+-transporting ATPase subunit gamma
MNLRQIRTKIKAVDNIKKITNAMELISSIKMKKAQQEYLEGRQYSQYLNIIFQKVINQVKDKNLLLMNNNAKVDRRLYIIIGSNKGLCGTFNLNIYKKIIEIDLNNSPAFIIIGKKISSLLSKIGAEVLADFSNYNPSEIISPLFDFVVNKFIDGEFKEVYIIFNQFFSGVVSKPIQKKLLPIDLMNKNIGDEEKNNGIEGEEIIIEPSLQILAEKIFSSLIELEIRDAILSSQVSEHAARMLAMKNATDNAKELVYNLILIRNRIRQEKITYELLDMITAKESISA